MEKKEKLGPQSVTRRTVVKGIAATGVVEIGRASCRERV